MNPATDQYSAMYCLTCYYNLRGLTSDRCPECGRFFNPSSPSTFSPTPKPTATREVMERIAKALDQLTETSDPEAQLRDLRRHNPFFSEIFRLQQANEVLRLHVRRLADKLVAHQLLASDDVDEINEMIEDSFVEVNFIVDDTSSNSEEPEVQSDFLIELQRAAEGHAALKVDAPTERSVSATDDQNA
jgi:hypothetical protein